MSEGASSWPQSPGSVGEPRDNLGAGLSFPLRSAERCCPQCPLPPVAKSTKRTLLSGAVGKAPFPHAVMRDSSSPPRARMGPLFSAGRAWARQGAQYEDTTGIDSEHAVPVPPGHPGTPVPRDQAKRQRAPFQTLLWSKSHSHRRFAWIEGSGMVRFVPEPVWRAAWDGLGPLSQCGTIPACFWARLQPCSGEALGTRARTRSWPLPEPHLSTRVPHGA